MNKVSIITVGALMLSLSSFQSGMTKNQKIAAAMHSVTVSLNDLEYTKGGLLDAHVFLKNTDNSDRVYAERFEITQNTSKAELENIKVTAEDDGIKFNYTSKFDGDKLSKLSLDLSLDNKDEGRKQSMKTDLDMDGEFSYTLAWENDSNGKAKHISYGKTEDFDDADSADNFDQSFERMDSLASNMKEEMELEREKMKEEMDKMREDMKKDFKDFDEEDIEEDKDDKDDFSDSSSKDAKKIQAEMKEEMRKMKKDFKKQQKEMEAEMKEMKKQMKKQQNQDKKESKDEMGGGARV